MGKIFGISNLPVTTIESVLSTKSIVPKPVVRTIKAEIANYNDKANSIKHSVFNRSHLGKHFDVNK